MSGSRRRINCNTTMPGCWPVSSHMTASVRGRSRACASASAVRATSTPSRRSRDSLPLGEWCRALYRRPGTNPSMGSWKHSESGFGAIAASAKRQSSDISGGSRGCGRSSAPIRGGTTRHWSPRRSRSSPSLRHPWMVPAKSFRSSVLHALVGVCTRISCAPLPPSLLSAPSSGPSNAGILSIAERSIVSSPSGSVSRTLSSALSWSVIGTLGQCFDRARVHHVGVFGDGFHDRGFAHHTRAEYHRAGPCLTSLAASPASLVCRAPSSPSTASGVNCQRVPVRMVRSPACVAPQ